MARPKRFELLTPRFVSGVILHGERVRARSYRARPLPRPSRLRGSTIIAHLFNRQQRLSMDAGSDHERGVLTNDGGNGGGSNYPSSMRRAPLVAPERPAKNPPMSPPATAPTGPATTRPRACAGSRTDHIGVGGWRTGSPSSPSVGSRTSSSLKRCRRQILFARLRRWDAIPKAQ